MLFIRRRINRILCVSRSICGLDCALFAKRRLHVGLQRTLCVNIWSDANDTQELTEQQRMPECPKMGQTFKLSWILKQSSELLWFRILNILLLLWRVSMTIVYSITIDSWRITLLCVYSACHRLHHGYQQQAQTIPT